MIEKLDSTSADCVYQRLGLHLPRDGGPSGPALPPHFADVIYFKNTPKNYGLPSQGRYGPPRTLSSLADLARPPDRRRSSRAFQIDNRAPAGSHTKLRRSGGSAGESWRAGPARARGGLALG